jgi:hypothetical protein
MKFDLDQTAIEAVFDVPDNDGLFSASQQSYFRALGARRPAVFLAFPPKAAGTFLRQAVIGLTGGDLVRIVHAQGGRDAQPYLPTFLAYFHGGVCKGPMVSHVHMQALPSNVHFVEAFDLRPVIMVRSIPDMLASYCDMLDREPGALRQGLNGVVPLGWPALSRARKADFLIDMLAPWYVNFFATWFDYAARAQDRVLVLRYGDFLAAPAPALQTLLAHSRLPVSLEACEDVLEDIWFVRDTLRFNHGKEGRGADYFSPAHLAQLERLMSHHPVLDGHQADLLGR